MTSKLKLSIESLKKRINDQQYITVQHCEGWIFDAYFEWNPPAQKSEIDLFVSKTGYVLPSDYETFLAMHNGAKLFMSPDKSEYVHLFTLEEIMEYYEDYDIYYKGAFPPSWYMIGRFQGAGEYVFIDSHKVTKHEAGYLYYSVVGDTIELNINFETWLDRLIVAQGERYWIWD